MTSTMGTETETIVSYFPSDDLLSTFLPLLIVHNGSVNGTVATSVGADVDSGGVFESDLIIPLYVGIFLLSVVGNSMVLITLAQNKRMRTVTNVYLLNLAVSDLLLGVFCMPFTLVGQVLRNFIFGDAMCKMIPFFQAVSVSVAVWTLVAISLERYFAICRPLKSRRWQTQFHAYKMIVVVWLASLLWNIPILAVSRLKATRQGKHKCREEWPSPSSERVYNIFLDVMLLLVPLVIMTLAYSLIVSKLWKGLQREIRHHSSCRRQCSSYSYPSTSGYCASKNLHKEKVPTHYERTNIVTKCIGRNLKTMEDKCLQRLQTIKYANSLRDQDSKSTPNSTNDSFWENMKVFKTDCLKKLKSIQDTKVLEEKKKSLPSGDCDKPEDYRNYIKTQCDTVTLGHVSKVVYHIRKFEQLEVIDELSEDAERADPHPRPTITEFYLKPQSQENQALIQEMDDNIKECDRLCQRVMQISMSRLAPLHNYLKQ